MPLSTLDANVALVVIDLQDGLRGVQTVHPMDDVIGRTAELASAFRRHQLPVVLVNVTGQPPGRTDASGGNAPRASTPPAGYADLVDELDAQPNDHRITKQRWGAFTDTDLHERLQEHGVTQVVIAGIATSLGVESTARSAHEHGYNVVLATDAMTDRDPDAHSNSVARIFPRLGESATVSEVVGVLPHLVQGA